jgi:hypothetical protein
MTEAEWLSTTRPYDLIHFRANRSERKRRLLACAFARRVLPLIPEERYRLAVETAERYADGMADEAELRTTRRVIQRAWRERQFTEAGNHAATAVLATLAREAVGAVHCFESAAAARASLTRPDWHAGSEEETSAQCVLARDVFGNPFRSVTLDPAWLAWNGSTVRHLAQAVYDGRAFDRLPVLADALEDAGCTDAVLLAHCRWPGPHVRGCWVLDLLLGKA